MIAGAVGLIATLTVFGGRRDGDTVVETRRDVY